MQSYIFETHCHTKETSWCANVPGKQIVQLYKQIGYAGVVITDHYYGLFFDDPTKDFKTKMTNYLKGYYAAKEEGVKTDMKVFLGLEIRFNEDNNDYLVYGVEESFLFKHPDLYKLSRKDFFTLAIENDLLVYRAHPYRGTSADPDIRFIHGLETYNGNPRQESQNEKAHVFARDKDLGILSGSDFHESDELGFGGVILPHLPKSNREFTNMLRGNEIAGVLKQGQQMSMS